MLGYDLYTLILCLIVFVLLTIFSSVVISMLTKQALRLIKCGADDEKITKEYYKELNAEENFCYYTFDGNHETDKSPKWEEFLDRFLK